MKLLVVCNNAPLYRKGIFSLIDQTYNCDWLFGEALDDIKQFDVKLLRGKVSIKKRVSMFGGKAYWQKGVIKQLFKGYSHYILLGEERCISTWLFILMARLCPSKKVYFWTHGPYDKEKGSARLFFTGKIKQLKTPQYIRKCIMCLVFYKKSSMNNWFCEPISTIPEYY